MEQLAIFGGEPVRKTPISYGHQYIDDADIEAVANVLRSDALTCGPKVTELEKRLCEVTGANYVVMVSNGTAALHLSAMAAGHYERGRGNRNSPDVCSFLQLYFVLWRDAGIC